MSQKCDRCGSPTHVTTMSYFNTDIICDECDDLEKLHPGYHEAKEAENAQVAAGNFNFEGTGLPIGYREWARAKKQELSLGERDTTDVLDILDEISTVADQ